MKDQVSAVREFSAFLCMEGAKSGLVPLKRTSDVWGQCPVPSHLRSPQSAPSCAAVAVGTLLPS